MHKILIIKVGYSETLDQEISNVTSYGDVLRSSVLLNLYKDNHVTWLVDEKAFPILKNNPYIDRILRYDITSILQLQYEHFDTVINLEKVPGICALADSIKAWRRYGFRLNVKTGEAESYDGSHNALSLCNDENLKKNHNKTWNEHLYEMVGAKWNKEEYVFGIKPLKKEKFDIGFNYMVGNKWPRKTWPIENWKTLESLINNKYKLSWQQGLENMEEYFNWINNCKLLVTNDSFGLHIALALKKKVVALFGPTNPVETYLYDRGVAIIPNGTGCKYRPCYAKTCKNSDKLCVGDIKPEKVLKEIKKVIGDR